MLVQDSRGQGYDRVLLSQTKDAGEAFAVLQEGEWSAAICQEFETESGTRTGVFRCNLVELSPDAEAMRLYVTQICATDGWSFPAELAAEIPSELGLPASTGESIAFKLGWIDHSTPLIVNPPSGNESTMGDGYGAFKSACADRQKMIFVGSNGGMLHAFKGEDGDELWAYIPFNLLYHLKKLG